MIFESYIKTNQAAFISKLTSIAAQLGTDAENLMAVMYLESRLNPQAYNPNGGATGLIQFMPATAFSLGTTTANLMLMSNVQQLDYVYRYFAPYTGRLKTFADVYSVTFFPIMLGKPDTWVLQSSTLSPEKIAKANTVFDLNKDSQITAGEFRNAIFQLLPTEIALYLRTKTGSVALASFSAVSLALIGIGGYFAIKALRS